jgi:biopolymer transport protein ExbD
MKLPIEENEEAKFAMAPMIDMVFLLLVFFMCASHLSSRSILKLDMPIASKGVVPRERPDRWVVNIMEDGSLYSGADPVDLDALKARIGESIRQDPNLKVYLRADANAAHKEVKAVMTTMAEAGIDDFIFGVYTPSPAIEGEP